MEEKIPESGKFYRKVDGSRVSLKYQVNSDGKTVRLIFEFQKGLSAEEKKNAQTLAYDILARLPKAMELQVEPRNSEDQPFIVFRTFDDSNAQAIFTTELCTSLQSLPSDITPNKPNEKHHLGGHINPPHLDIPKHEIPSETVESEIHWPDHTQATTLFADEKRLKTHIAAILHECTGKKELYPRMVKLAEDAYKAGMQKGRVDTASPSRN